MTQIASLIPARTSPPGNGPIVSTTAPAKSCTVTGLVVRIAAVPGAGATVRVFKSASPPSLIAADAAAGRLTYANFNGGDLSTLSSNWSEWSTGSVTTYGTEGTIDGSAWSAVIAISTGGTANLEIVQTP